MFGPPSSPSSLPSGDSVSETAEREISYLDSKTGTRMTFIADSKAVARARQSISLGREENPFGARAVELFESASGGDVHSSSKKYRCLKLARGYSSSACGSNRAYFDEVEFASEEAITSSIVT